MTELSAKEGVVAPDAIDRDFGSPDITQIKTFSVIFGGEENETDLPFSHASTTLMGTPTASAG